MHTRHCPWRIAATSVLAFGLSACSSPREGTARREDAPQPTATAAQPAAAVPTGASSYEGFHDATNCQTILGWVWDQNRPDAPVSVLILDGFTPLATVVANLPRSDLAGAGKGNGQHGFRYQVPASLKDGKPHVVRIMVSETNFQLRGTPKNLTCPR